MKISNFYEKIYVIHWKPLKERKEYLEKIFKQLELTKLVTWVDQYETNKDVKHVKNPFNLNSKLLMVNMSHLYCYKDQLKHGYKNILILEDDVDFENLNIITYLNQSAEEFIELDGDIAFLSTCCGLNVKNIKPPQLLYYDPNYITRCCGAYIVNKRCVEKLIECVINCHAIDRMLNSLIPLINVRCLWSGYPIKQGSETGKYNSALLDIRDSNGNYTL
jgi:GR25 family glycosyltransferase involved in LPS biosynthesis